MKKTAEEYELEVFLRNTHTLVSHFHPEMPDYVHPNTSVSDIFMLVNYQLGDPYLNSAPDNYLEDIVNNFPDLYDWVSTEENSVETDYAIDVTPLMQNIYCWSKQTLDTLVELLDNGTIRVVKTKSDKLDFELMATFH